MYASFFKRIFDVILAVFLLLWLWPVMLLTTLIIGIKMGRPVLFRQQRLGYHSQSFTMVKFRTMTLSNTADNDAVRITKLGNFLRKSSLDELPELWNILKGEMSFVGPRPLLIEYAPYYSQEQKKRHNVRPGLTGLAQVNGRNATSWEERFAQDVHYAETVSLLGDLGIAFKTIRTVFVQEGVNANDHATMQRFDHYVQSKKHSSPNGD